MKLSIAVELVLSSALLLSTCCDAFVVVPKNAMLVSTSNSNSNSNSKINTVGNNNSLRNTSSNSQLQMSNSEEMDIDDEDYDPLKNGVDSVSWLPSLNDPSSTSSSSSTPSSSSGNMETLPFFPLGGIVYTPNSEHVLNIFEPRYRQMYNDILMNGSKRFVVSMSHPNQDATFATTGVIFHLEDLKEVSEMTDDQVKYICNHKVTNRVKLNRVVNPQVWKTRETYLKVEGSILYEDESTGEQTTSQSITATTATTTTTQTDADIDETDENESKESKDEIVSSDIYKTIMDEVKKSSSPLSSSSSSSKHKYIPEEMILIASFQNLVDKQHDANEDVRFTKESYGALAVAPGSGEDGLWQTIRLWQSFIDQRLVARQNEMQREFQEKLLEFLKKEKGISEKELPSAIGFNDLSPALQKEVRDLQKRMNVELQPLVLESTLTIQKILESKDHKARCLLLRHFIDVEKKRLDAKSTLQGMFAGDKNAVTEMEDGQTLKKVEDEDKDEESDDDDDDDKSYTSDDTESSSQQGALFFDEPDAFQ